MLLGEILLHNTEIFNILRVNFTLENSRILKRCALEYG